MAKQYTAKEIEQIMLLMQDTVSLNTPIGILEDGEMPDELLDFIPDDSPSPEEELLEKNKTIVIEKFMKKCLNDREQLVIRARFGLDDGHYRTLEDVGQMLGITRERVRQIELRAIRKLRFQFSYHKINRGNI